MIKLLRQAVLAALRRAPGRAFRKRRLLHTAVRARAGGAGGPLRVLVLGVYLADRPNTAAHLRERLANAPGFEVEQRWIGLGGTSTDPALAAVTDRALPGLHPKFVLINRLLRSDDAGRHDYILVCDDDIHLPPGFLPAFLAEQQALDWAVAQPARTLYSHFDHAFALRRPWLRGRQTWFVECGPLVSFRRDAAALLMPFEHPEQMWGLDLVWPLHLRRVGLKMGIVDAVPVDHSLRPQAAHYDKIEHDVAMHRFLAATPHLPMREAFRVVATHRRGGA